MLPPKKLLCHAIVKVLNDTFFNSKAPNALETIPNYISDACQQRNNEPSLIAYAKNVVTSFHKLLESVSRSRSGESIILYDHQSLFLTKGTHPIPILYEHVTDVVFRAVIGMLLKLLSMQIVTRILQPWLSLRKCFALCSRIYVCQHLCRTLARRSHPLKDDLILCLSLLRFIANSPPAMTNTCLRQSTENAFWVSSLGLSQSFVGNFVLFREKEYKPTNKPQLGLLNAPNHHPI